MRIPNGNTNDKTQSNENQLFNFQPFVLRELVPETQEPGGTIEKSSKSSESSKFSLGTRSRQLRTHPWLREELVEEPFVFATKPFNPINRAMDTFSVSTFNDIPIQASNARPREYTTKGTRVFQADAILNESHKQSVDFTSYPIDRLGNVSDHVRVKDYSITVTALHSAQVATYTDLLSNLQNNFVTEGFDKLVNYWTDTAPRQTRTQAVYDLLMEWERTGQIVAVYHAFALNGVRDGDLDSGELVPFIITNVSVPRNKDIGRAIKVSFTLKKAKLVTIGETTTIVFDPQGRPVRTPGGTKKKKKPKLDGFGTDDPKGKKPSGKNDRRYKKELPGSKK